MNYDTQSQRTASLVAGLALALMAVLAAFGNFVALQPLVTPGDAVKTAIDISNSEAMFRWGIASLIGMVISVIFARIISEFVLIMFRINEHLGAIRERDQRM